MLLYKLVGLRRVLHDYFNISCIDGSWIMNLWLTVRMLRKKIMAHGLWRRSYRFRNRNYNKYLCIKNRICSQSDESFTHIQLNIIVIKKKKKANHQTRSDIRHVRYSSLHFSTHVVNFHNKNSKWKTILNKV